MEFISKTKEEVGMYLCTTTISLLHNIDISRIVLFGNTKLPVLLSKQQKYYTQNSFHRMVDSKWFAKLSLQE